MTTEQLTTDELVERLASSAVPVRRALGPAISTALWVAAAGAGVAIVNSRLFHLRDDLHLALSGARLCASVVTLGLLTVLGALDAIRGARPGASPRPVLDLGVRLSFWAFLLTLALDAWGADPVRVGLDPAGAGCSRILLVLSLVPGILLVLAVRRLAPVDPARSGRLVGLAVGAIGALGLALDCPVEHALHLLVWHGLPLVALRIGAEKAASFLFRW